MLAAGEPITKAGAERGSWVDVKLCSGNLGTAFVANQDVLAIYDVGDPDVKLCEPVLLCEIAHGLEGPIALASSTEGKRVYIVSSGYMEQGEIAAFDYTSDEKALASALNVKNTTASMQSAIGRIAFFENEKGTRLYIAGDQGIAMLSGATLEVLCKVENDAICSAINAQNNPGISVSLAAGRNMYADRICVAGDRHFALYDISDSQSLKMIGKAKANYAMPLETVDVVMDKDSKKGYALGTRGIGVYDLTAEGPKPLGCRATSNIVSVVQGFRVGSLAILKDPFCLDSGSMLCLVGGQALAAFKRELGDKVLSLVKMSAQTAGGDKDQIAVAADSARVVIAGAGEFGSMPKVVVLSPAVYKWKDQEEKPTTGAKTRSSCCAIC